MDLGTLAEEVGIVNPLSSGQNLLTPHEHVVRVGVLRVRRVRHCVERANRQRVLVL